MKNNEVATLLDLNNLIIDINNKMGKNDLIQLNQLSQEIKELMTGGNDRWKCCSSRRKYNIK